jgi:hypothetical protein
MAVKNKNELLAELAVLATKLGREVPTTGTNEDLAALIAEWTEELADYSLDTDSASDGTVVFTARQTLHINALAVDSDTVIPVVIKGASARIDAKLAEMLAEKKLITLG